MLSRARYSLFLPKSSFQRGVHQLESISTGKKVLLRQRGRSLFLLLLAGKDGGRRKKTQPYKQLLLPYERD